ncbi:YlmC/YmxH family sporulation protein [Aeribacillus pallidus]|jgi:YlmC/YmxH family sporulation protein|uniref:YlmC/YmxH family sporulation protein n=1 Tax=Aeribacillus pallidus TaxID=33936 RepID=UPI003D1C3237
MVRISEFQIKDVVNISDGRRLGNIVDFEINTDTGKITAVIIGGSGKLFGFLGKDDDLFIPWTQIVKIGADVILVRLKESTTFQYQLEKPKE